MEGPGIGHKRIGEIESAADKFLAISDKRKRLKEAEDEAKKTLVSRIQKHREALGMNGSNETIYRYDDLVLIVTEKMNIKIKESIAEGDEE